MRFAKRYDFKNDIKFLEKCLSELCIEKHSIVFLRNNRIVSVCVEFLVDISDDIFSSEYVRYVFCFNELTKRLFKLLSVYCLTTEYHAF